MTRSTPAPDLLVGDVIRHAARATPHELAATLGDDEMTFAELDARSNQVAHALSARGVGLGDRVAWWGETSLDAMPIFNALARLGAAFMPVNARLGADEAADVLEYAKPSLLIADAAHAALAEGWDPPALTHAELFAAADREASTDDGVPAGLTEDATHVVFFTSGSTGRPKGVVLSHRTSWLRSFQGNLTDHTGGTVCMFPLFHMSGWSMTHRTRGRRAARCTSPLRSPHALLSTAERRRATRLYHIPAVWQRVLEHDRSALRPVDGARVRHRHVGDTTRAPRPRSRTRSPARSTRIFYGEHRGRAGSDARRRRPARGSRARSGRPRSACPCALVDGEVCVRSPFLMDGYFEHPDANAEALARSSPAARPGTTPATSGSLDDEGYLSIVGRARDVLRTGGETVAPARGRGGARRRIPTIAEVAVVGIPDTEWGEIVSAVVVVRAGRAAMPTLDALRAHCERPPRTVQAARGASSRSTRSRARPRPARSSAR